MGMEMSICLELNISLRLDLSEAPTPPEPPPGIEGLRLADQILKDYGSCGILVGSVAKHIWLGVDDVDDLDNHKDTDVVCLSGFCHRHPGQWEGGIDWWVRHSIMEAPTNGTGYILKYLFSLEPPQPMPPGLYLCPRELVIHSIKRATLVWGNKLDICCREILSRPNFREFPIMPKDFLRIAWFNPDRHRVAEHCRPWQCEEG